MLISHELNGKKRNHLKSEPFLFNIEPKFDEIFPVTFLDPREIENSC